MTKKHWTGLGLVVGVGNGWLDRILIGDSVQGSGDTAGGSEMHIRGLGVVRDCLDESGLSLDTTRVCLGTLGCHGYESTLYPSSSTSLTPRVRRKSILKSILGMCTIWFASPRVMSGKPPSGLATAPMSGR